MTDSSPRPHSDGNKTKEKSCSFGMRTKIFTEGPKPGPGPLGYNPPSVTRFGKNSGPSYSFSTGKRFPGKEITPGPGSYCPVTSSSFARPINTKLLKGTFGSRDLTKRSLMSVKTDNPGPASYGVPSLDKVKCSGPKISMGARLMAKEEKTIGPGPNAYNIGGMSKLIHYPKERCTFGLRRTNQVCITKRANDL